MGVCRSVRVAAWFVVGYCINNEVAVSDAWAEVYLLGDGLLGFDPGRGLPTSNEYIVVATGQCPQDAAPTLEHFRG